MDPGQKYATCSEKIHRVQKRKLELYYDRQLEKENGLNDRLMKMDAINSRKIEKERHANRRREANIKQFDSRNLNGVEVSIP